MRLYMGYSQYKVCLIFIVFFNIIGIILLENVSYVYFASLNLLFTCLHKYWTGEIHPSLGNLQNLAHLDLGNNYLTGPIPTTLRNLTNLEYLGLFSNNLTGKHSLTIWVLIFSMIPNLNLHMWNEILTSSYGNLWVSTLLWFSKVKKCWSYKITWVPLSLLFLQPRMVCKFKPRTTNSLSTCLFGVRSPHNHTPLKYRCLIRISNWIRHKVALDVWTKLQVVSIWSTSSRLVQNELKLIHFFYLNSNGVNDLWSLVYLNL